MIASLIETTAAWGNQMVSALLAVHGRKPRRIEPLRIEHPDRPKGEPEKKPSASPAEIQKFFSRL